MTVPAAYDTAWRESCERELAPVTTTITFSHDGDFHVLALRALAELLIALGRYDSVGDRVCGLEMTDTTLTVTMRQ